MSFVTAHVLDAAAGRPAQGVEVRLQTEDGGPIAEAVTNHDGRVPDLGPDHLAPGIYRVTFEVDSYAGGAAPFYPRVSIDFRVAAGQAHYHIPLLLSPYSYTTYRGS